MENKKALQALLAALHKEPPSVLTEVQTKGAKIAILDNGLFTYFMEGEQVCKGYAAARTLDGREIDTRRAKLVSSEMILGEDAGGSAFSGDFSGKKGVRLLYRQGQLELRHRKISCTMRRGRRTPVTWCPLELLIRTRNGRNCFCHWIRKCCWCPMTMTCGRVMSRRLRLVGEKVMT